MSSLQTKIQALIDSANTTTGGSDATLTAAVQSLVDGYGAGGTTLTGWTLTGAQSSSNGIYTTFVATSYGISDVGSYLFANNNGFSWFIRELILNEGVTRIGAGAFYNNQSLAGVSLPSTIVRIDGNAASNGAFRGCSALTSIALPASLTLIQPYAFRGCSSLTSPSIAEGFDCVVSFYDISAVTTDAVSAIVTNYKDNSATGVTRTLTLHATVYAALAQAIFDAATAKGLTIASA